MIDALLDNFGDHPGALELARARLNSADGKFSLRPVAIAGRHHPEIRETVRSVALPLPIELRRRLTQRLFERRSPDWQPTACWRLEADGMTASAAASANALSIPADQQTALIDDAIDALHARKIDRDVEGQAGLCVLLELRELARFAEQSFFNDPTKPLWIEFGTLRRNWWLAARVAEHFEDVQAVLGADMLERFHDHPPGHRFWATLAPFATQTPALSDAVLSFIREHGTGGAAELLRFLAAARPASRELADALVAAATGTIVDRTSARTALLLSAELLTQHFAGDDEVLAALLTDGYPSEGELLALAMGWRATREAQARFELASSAAMPLSLDVAVRLHLLLGTPEEALNALCSWLPQGEAQDWLVAPPTTAALMRTVGDPRFAAILSARITQTDAPSEIGSGARLLTAAGRLEPETRAVIEAKCEAALTGTETDLIGLDMLAEELRPLGWMLWDALHGVGATDRS